jgi:hypothetical protein
MNKRLYLIYFLFLVLQVFWKHIAEVCGKSLGTDFESAVKWWLHDKKNKNYQCVHHNRSLDDLGTQK